MRRVRHHVAAIVTAGALALSCAPPPGAVRPAPAPDAGLAILPPRFDPLRAYPVVELLPPTGNTAEAMLQIWLGDVGLGRLAGQTPREQLEALWPDRDCIVVLAYGRGSAGDYGSGPAWAQTIERYERRVLADLRGVAATVRVDTTRLVVAGFSMGGDLAWALALRNPAILHGAIVMASRATYRPAAGGATALVQSGTRFVLTMGTRDEGVRRRLAQAAAADLERWGVPHRFETIEGAGHGPAPLAVFTQALAFVLGP